MDLEQEVHEVLSKRSALYLGVMFLLVILSIVNFFVDSPYSNLIDNLILFSFFLDTCYQLIKSKNPWQYVRTHPLDFVALIPISGSFRTVKIIPLLMQCLRFTTIGNHFLFPVIAKLKKTGIGRTFWYFILLIFLLPLPLLWLEPAIKDYGTLMWWTVNTVTTVGYGDITIKTAIGRVIASILMLLGVGLIGTVTGSLLQMMTSPEGEKKKSEPLKEKASESTLTLEEIELLEKILHSEKEQMLKQEKINDRKE